MNQIEYDSVKKQQLIEEQHERSTQTYSETLEQINRQLSASQKNERKLTDKVELQSDLLLHTEEKLQDMIERYESVKGALRKNSQHYRLCVVDACSDACLNEESHLECNSKESSMETPVLNADENSQKDVAPFQGPPRPDRSAMEIPRFNNHNLTNITRTGTNPEWLQKTEIPQLFLHGKEHVQQTNFRIFKVRSIMKYFDSFFSHITL
ncbi:hypothetical protein PSHT_12582 [Puccinia striiformis]|uniref:Uncharacterized protein n=1 Tax=Puccinia striiformis TaxID=27350 RepID=A0A2S4UVP9_9BASI|nr:hypothetical protein PSHT_12582 [Puccinia striiformis]